MSASENMRATAVTSSSGSVVTGSAPNTPAENTTSAELPQTDASHREPSTSAATLTAANETPQNSDNPAAPVNRPANRPAKKRPPVTPPTPVVEHSSLAPAPVSASVLKEMRQKRAKKLLTRVLALVVLPTVLSAIYFGLVASNEYESTTIIVIERRQPTHLGSPFAANDDNPESSAIETSKSPVRAKTASTPALKDDLPLVKDYVLSRDMLALLDQKLALLSHYGDPKIDVLSRLSTHASREQAYGYYVKKISASHDPGAATLSLKVRAFDSATASKASDFILQSAEQMLSELPRRAQQDSLKLTEAELERIRAESVEVDAALARVTATDSKKTAANNNPAGPSSDTKDQAVAASSRNLQKLTARADRVQRRLALVEERARLLRDELKYKTNYIVRVAGPSEPDDASYPQRGRAVITTFLFSVVAMGILSLLVSAVREHTNL